MIVNIRGPNGAGKSTAARFFLPADMSTIELSEYVSPTKTDPTRRKTVVGYHERTRDVAVVGSYRTACGGMDSIPNFEEARRSIALASTRARHVVAEGVLASTVFESWSIFAKMFNGSFAFAYLRVSADECLRRVYERNGGKKIDEELVRGKWRAVEGTRKKALAAHHLVYDLPLGEGEAGPAIWAIMRGEGEKWRAS